MKPLLKSILLLLATLPAPACAFGLLDGFRLAQRNDPLYQAARAERDAGQVNHNNRPFATAARGFASASRSKVNVLDRQPF